jgi:lysophospholipase L1-like esterase
MTRLTLAILGLLLVPQFAMAQSCPTPAQRPPTTEPSVKKGHEIRFAAKVARIEQQLATQSFAAIGLGDSIMQRWPQDMLSTSMGMKTLDAGIGGDTTEALLWRLENMNWSRQSPRYVLILIGTNDGGHFAGCDVYWGIRAVVDKARQLFPKARIIVTSVLPRGASMLERDAEIGLTNAALRAAANTARFNFFDVHDALLCDHRTPCDLVVPPTNVHPTPKGYQVIGDFLRKYLASLPR